MSNQPIITEVAAPKDAPSGNSLGAKTVPPLGSRVASGIGLMLGQTILLKVLSIGSQIVVAWFVQPGSVGAFSLAMTVVALANVINDGGISQVLVHRRRRADLWATPGFWLSLSVGLLASVAVLAAAPIAAQLYDAVIVKSLLLVLWICPLISAVGAVPNSQLQGDLRFKAIAVIGILSTIASAILTIYLAMAGWEEYSLAIPVVVASIVRSLGLWIAAPVKVRLAPQFRRWRFIAVPSGRIMLGSLLATVTMQADYAILGIFADSSAVGVYFFGFNVSMQFTLLVAGTASAALFPALSALQREPIRQLAAFRRSAHALAAIAIPASLLQVAVAGPAIPLVFGAKWVDAVPIIQILSLGMSLQILNGIAGSLIQAQGRFGDYLRVTTFLAVMMPVLVMIGAWYGGAVGVAVGAAVSAAVAGTVVPYVALRPAGGHPFEVWSVYAAPLSAGGIAAGIAMLAGRFSGNELSRFIIIAVVFLLAYLPILFAISPTSFRGLRTLAEAIVYRRADGATASS